MSPMLKKCCRRFSGSQAGRANTLEVPNIGSLRLRITSFWAKRPIGEVEAFIHRSFQIMRRSGWPSRSR
jgi:hypothetical protein